jgi:hypothetical protein
MASPSPLRFGFDQFAFDAAQFDVAVEHEIEGAVGQGRRFLGDAGDVPAGRQFDIAGFGVQFAGEQREQAGFAAAVGADDADLPAGVQLNGGVDNQGAADAGEGDLAEGDHEGANYSGGLLKSFASSGRFGAIPAATLMGAFKVLQRISSIENFDP